MVCDKDYKFSNGHVAFRFRVDSTTFLVEQMVKNLPAMQETQVQSQGWKDPLEEGIFQPTPVFLPREIHGQLCLVGYCPWNHKETDTTKQLTYTHTHVHIAMVVIYV